MKALSLFVLLTIGLFPTLSAAQKEVPAASDSSNSTSDQAAPTDDLADDLEVLPVLKTFVEADYPPRALKEEITAEVVMAIDIDITGRVEAVAIVKHAEPQGYGFDEAAVAAAMLFEFTAAEAGGEPVPVQILYRYKFTLQIKPPPTAQPTAPQPDPVANFTGQLLERGTRKPLAGAVVTVFRLLPQDEGANESDAASEGFEALADAQGRFKFWDLTVGAWKVLVQPDGYFPFRTTEEIRTSEKVEATYYVERGSYNPFDVMVTASRPRKEVSRTTLETEEIEKIPGAMGDPISVVQNVPGVARTSFGDGSIIVRGSSPSNTAILVEGMSVPLLYHFGNLRSIIPAGMLESVDFYPGNFPVEYGRATAGILDVRIKRAMPEKAGGYVDISLMDTGLFLEAPVGSKASVAIAGRRSYVDTVLNAVTPEDAEMGFVTAPRYYDYQLLANYRPTPAHELRAFLFGSDDRLAVLFQNPADVDSSYEGGGLNLKLQSRQLLVEHRYVPTASFKHRLRLSVGQYVQRQEIGTQLRVNLSANTTMLREDFSWKLSETLQLRSGLDISSMRAKWDVEAPPPPKEGEAFPATPDFTYTKVAKRDVNSFDPAIWAQMQWQPAKGWSLTPGLRVDYASIIDEVMASPRLGIRVEFNERWLAKGGVGLFHRKPDEEESSIEFGNPDLLAERAIHYTAGAEYKPLKHLTIDGQVFYKAMSRLTSRSSSTVVRDGESVPMVYDSTGKGRVYGAEWMVRHNFSNGLFGWMSYTVSRAERMDSGSESYRLFDQDQTHIFTVLGTYKLPMNWEVGGRWRLVSGNPTTPINGSVYNSDNDAYEPVLGETNSDRLEAFHQLDLRVDKRWVYQDWMLSIYLDIQNVYSRANTEGVSYSFDYTESQPAAGLPLLTILGIRGEF